MPVITIIHNGHEKQTSPCMHIKFMYDFLQRPVRAGVCLVAFVVVAPCRKCIRRTHASTYIHNFNSSHLIHSLQSRYDTLHHVTSASRLRHALPPSSSTLSFPLSSSSSASFLLLPPPPSPPTFYSSTYLTRHHCPPLIIILFVPAQSIKTNVNFINFIYICLFLLFFFKI